MPMLSRVTDKPMTEIFPVGSYRSIFHADGTIYHGTVQHHGVGSLVLVGCKVWDPGYVLGGREGKPLDWASIPYDGIMDQPA